MPPSDDVTDAGIDQRFRALLEGLRTTIPGVMVLFAFLLTVPLSNPFAAATTDQRVSYYLAFAAAGTASVLLIAPSVHQRVRAPLTGIPRKDLGHVRIAVHLALAGTVAAAIAIGAVAWFVTSLLFGAIPAAAVATVALGLTSWAWFWLPVVSFRTDDDGRPGYGDRP
jgi:hypothetical protein